MVGQLSNAMWKFLNESSQGTSHRAIGLPCQDASFVTPYRVGEEEVLILACADGAGSAIESQVGAALACAEGIRQATGFFDAGRSTADISPETLREWLLAIHNAITVEAEKREVSARDMACTFLMAVVGEQGCGFAQIGDGAIVVSRDDEMRTVFWPQSGEYHNMTRFISDSDFEEHVQIEVRGEAVDELALLTDGLQMLALSYANQTVHAPFLRGMFKALRDSEDFQDLIVPMRQFLDSTAVNERTDDDKTLILATRASRDHAAF